MNDDMWRGELITTFPSRSEIRELAIAEMSRRGGNIGAVSHQYGNDEGIRALVLARLCPLGEADRQNLVHRVELAATSNAAALEGLEAARQGTDGAVCGEAIVG